MKVPLQISWLFKHGLMDKAMLVKNDQQIQFDAPDHYELFTLVQLKEMGFEPGEDIVASSPSESRCVRCNAPVPKGKSYCGNCG